MSNSKLVYIGGFAVIALMVIVTLAVVDSESEFGGADDAAEGVIGELDPDYEPWTSGIWGEYELPGETESMLFALQAAIGAIIIGYFIGRYSAKKS